MNKPAVFEWTLDCCPPGRAADEIQCWRFDLDDPQLQDRLPLDVLSRDEQARAERFRFAEVARRFRTGRAALRLLLAQYTGNEPQRLGFAYGALGKPVLKTNEGMPLAFNLTHSGNIALVAVGPPGDIGIDVEVIRKMDDQAGLVRRYFAPNEVAEFESMEVEERPRAFFVGWTRKEAAIKATGEGIAANLEAIEVGFGPREDGFAIRWQGSQSLQSVRIWDLDVGPDLAAALAVVDQP